MAQSSVWRLVRGAEMDRSGQRLMTPEGLLDC